MLTEVPAELTLVDGSTCVAVIDDIFCWFSFRFVFVVLSC